MPRTEVLASLTRTFGFPISAYDGLVDQFIQELDQGLSQDGQMPMIPTFVYDLPSGQEKGVVLSLDLGGTNLRVVQTLLQGEGQFEVHHKKWPIPLEKKKGPGVELLAWMADCIREFVQEHKLEATEEQESFPLGMTFSFPVEQLDINVGNVLFWTKGFQGNDLIGKDVVAVLQSAIDARSLPVKVNALINDTVGTLLATAYRHPGCEIGIIFGTGTNCAYVEDQAKITKIKPTAANFVSPTGEQIINTEWGAFGNTSGALPSNVYDKLLDEKSSRPGQQSYEKMVSGLYISELVRIVIYDLAQKGELFMSDSDKPKSDEQLGDLAHKERLDGATMGLLEGDESEELEKIQQHFRTAYKLKTDLGDRKVIKLICQLISARAARLSSIGIAAIIRKRNLLAKSQLINVGIDGSLFHKYPNFRKHLEGALVEIFDAATVRSKIALINAEDGSGVGGAIAGLLASRKAAEVESA